MEKLFLIKERQQVNVEKMLKSEHHHLTSIIAIADYKGKNQ